jgi:hypothetical protein
MPGKHFAPKLRNMSIFIFEDLELTAKIQYILYDAYHS